VKPSNAVVFLDGKRVGDGTKVRTVTVTPGRHAIKVVHKKDEHQESVSVKKGETKHWQWAFEDDRPANRKTDGEGGGSDDPAPELPTDEKAGGDGEPAQ
jgi:hypothetical protein